MRNNIPMSRAIVIAMLLALALGCSKKAPEAPANAPGAAGNITAPSNATTAPAAPAQPGLSISPEKPDVKTVIKPSASGFDLAKASVAWSVNGKPVPTYDPMGFNPALDGAKKGDTVTAVATVDSKQYPSNAVTVQDSAPQLLKVMLLPEDAKTEEDIWVDAEAADADGDPVTFEYEWVMGGKVVSTTKGLSRDINISGTEFMVTVTPTDGELKGQSVSLRRTVLNIPPRIEANYDYTFDGNKLTYQIKATDPDGDKITYGVENPQPGMSVDAETGALRWDVPAALTNTTVPIVVTASDGRGGSARMELKFTLKTEPVTPAAANTPAAQ